MRTLLHGLPEIAENFLALVAEGEYFIPGMKTCLCQHFNVILVGMDLFEKSVKVWNYLPVK